jgi:hypothetical protein
MLAIPEVIKLRLIVLQIEDLQKNVIRHKSLSLDDEELHQFN